MSDTTHDMDALRGGRDALDRVSRSLLNLLASLRKTDDKPPQVAPPPDLIAELKRDPQQLEQ